MDGPHIGASMPQVTSSSAAPKERQRWLSILAKAPADRLQALWDALGPVPAYTVLRKPEIGLVMVNGRISGSGAPFAAGEMTVTRAAVRLQTGQLGIGYVGGRHPKQAETVAAIDALGQLPEWRQLIEEQIVTPLEQEAEARRRLRASKAAATKVDFFTVAREAGT
ncbi:MAG TPA: phosphonate C-P lyase system protein PhnG [Reyranella sp.]|nr:phosphonate C-P lyase system protein PhnG [Reyranella sp.]